MRSGSNSLICPLSSSFKPGVSSLRAILFTPIRPQQFQIYALTPVRRFSPITGPPTVLTCPTAGHPTGLTCPTAGHPTGLTCPTAGHPTGLTCPTAGHPTGLTCPTAGHPTGLTCPTTGHTGLTCLY
ncbi:hypothetical protein CEXT_603811 [Caerostris extrusa]|uniref:Uncharacterized protein n=1 Tax=Caerostris extrusa TaxID=172846 RepID=A0AAV4MHQ5_CAEEX|nr:hypothetical protein CEXT_603811 [Caerostris extrusa]